MRNLIVFTVVLAIAVLGSAGIANAGSWDGTASGKITTLDNVGIGTTEPGLQLEVYGNSPAYTSGIKIQTPSNASAIIEQDTDDLDFINYSTWGSQTAGARLRFFTNNDTITPKMIIQKDGKVGIGTMNPGLQLGVYGKSTSGIEIQTFSNASAIIEQDTDDLDFINYSPWGSQTAGARLRFFTNNDTITPKMIIQKDGKVGIGTTEPGAKLDVVGDIIADDIYVDVDGDGYSETSLVDVIKLLMQPGASGISRYGKN